MIIILIAFMFVAAYNMKISPIKKFNHDYISKKNSNAIKGIFVFMVFISHFVQYYDMTTAFDNPYRALKTWLGQLIVTMFFFYSGYGILESVKRKGHGYVSSFPKNRVLKVLVHMVLAVLIFLVFNIIINRKFSVIDYLLATIGWESVGNSNWFIFVILVTYILVYISFMIFKKKTVLAITFTTVLSIIYVVLIIKFTDREHWWYDTVLCLAAGMWYSYFKDKIEKFVMKNDITYVITLAVAVAAVFILHEYRKNTTVLILLGIMFSLLVVLVTMKVSIGNKALDWLGNHVFSVYILQRIPMLIFSKFDLISSNRYLYFIASFVLTIILSELFGRLTGLIDKKFFTAKRIPIKKVSE